MSPFANLHASMRAHTLLTPRRAGAFASLALLIASSASAERIAVRVTVTNLAPTSSVSFAPLHVGFHAGIFDSFNEGMTAGMPIVSIAEGGSGSAWFPAFAMTEPDAALGTVLPMPAGPLLPGATGTRLFTIDSAQHAYFSFGAMAVPSNDYFIGNDDPMEYPLFGGGMFADQSLTLTASDLWDAGSEVDGIFGAAFVAGSMNDDRIADRGVVNFDFADLAIFDGVTTGAGYVFQSQLAADTPIYSIALERVQPVRVRVTVENLAPASSVSFAPLRVGFHDGSYDPFNEGETANAATISIAEGGSGNVFFADFGVAQPDALLGSVLPNPAGPLLPGGSGVAEFTVDPASQRYFTFGSMVVPSNDYFIGNDDPMAYDLFDANGEFMPRVIMQRGSDIWDAGSEVDGAFGAAFLMGSMNGDRIPDTGVVEFDFSDLSIFDGLTTAAGYVFASQLNAETPVYRITIEEVPPCDADLDGDGLVGPRDLGTLLGAWGGMGAGDLDGDGAIGMEDLSILLGAWGNCG
jgi:hypothetical protein